MYYFDPAGHQLRDGDLAVVETSKGLELGNVLKGNHEVPDEQVVPPLRPVVRPATPEDIRTEEQCRQREREAYKICRQKIAAHGLDMKLVDVECSFEGNKILFFFSSEGRVDFRELVKDLASVFRTRIELRQIGVRDEARMLGGLGMCGRPFCCCAFMDDFKPVSTKMAKVQNLSLNPAKISGCCGRLMCCLRYEQPAYEELVKNVPKNGAFVETPDGYGNVNQVNILRQTVRVKLDGMTDDAIRQYDADEVAAVPGGRPRDGSQPPHVLVLKPKAPKEPEPPENDPWEMPELLITTEEERARSAELRRDRASRARAEEPAPGEGAPRSGRQGRKRRGGGQKQSQQQPAREKTVQEASQKKPSMPRKPRPGKGQQPQQKEQGQKKGYAAAQGGPAPAEKTQKARSQRNYQNRRRPQNRQRPKGQEGGGRQEG